MSVFILSGPSLKATASLEGPLCPTDVDTGKELMEKAEKWQPNPGSDVKISETLDFEHLNEPVEEDDDDDDDETAEKEPPIDPNDPDAADKRRKRREKQREAFLAAKQKREQKRMLQQKKIREDGEPYLKTIKAPKSGWYRACVAATWYQVSWWVSFQWFHDMSLLS